MSNNKLTYSLKPANLNTEVELSHKIEQLEKQITEVNKTLEGLYGGTHWKLDGIQQQLANVTLWAKEAAHNTYQFPPQKLLLLISLGLNIFLILYAIRTLNFGF
ncbi:hypothetical protein NG798_14725 [Ancylothrix sp. C2]|uniref:hypothetical protein n=1 Tax=Ancylothrix sp. D3o TaxID=2953691 RepID=UPI0021BAA3C6|nr:hypothetical protein [Ancylothrix sp. D3o]MCT7951050.1 hypothetical protein [Ancylothrix sp. D3o]